jgi:predicted DNA-binding transcriptional regulator AlpA
MNLMTPDEVAELLRIERRAFMRSIAKQPDFPAPVRLGPRILRWKFDEVQLWLDRRTRRRP